MGLVNAIIELSNPRLPGKASVKVDCLVDSGAVTLCIPQTLATELVLEEREQRRVTMADGSVQTIPYVGPLTVAFANRHSFTGALVLGERVLVGALQMEDMDLIILPKEQRLCVNPASPGMASALVMDVRYR